MSERIVLELASTQQQLTGLQQELAAAKEQLCRKTEAVSAVQLSGC